MSETTKFTASFGRALLERVKVIAAKQNTSVSALLNAQLRHLVESYESASQCRNANYSTLLAFSLGRIDTQTALDRLGLDSAEDLIFLVKQANSRSVDEI